MKSTSFILAALLPVALALIMLLIFSIPERPAAKGATIYDLSKEVVVKGVVEKVWDFDCPESGGEVTGHLWLRTSHGHVEIHMAPERMLRHQTLTFVVGDQIEVIGSQVRTWDRNDVLAREITRGTEIMVLRDRQGNLLPHE